MDRIVALCGGVGGAKLAYGLSKILASDELTIIVNTGDDFEHLGLLICPDLDTVTYTLAGVENPVQGWGRAGETWTILDALGALDGETWFKLGDKDLALHLLRADMHARGESLTAITRAIAQQFKITHRIVPMSDDPVRTFIDTDAGPLAFQDYFVRHRCEPKVRAIRYEGALRAKPSTDAIAALSDPSLRGVVICPSNPYLSVAPILALPALRHLLQSISAPILAVSPIIGGKALKGPAAKIMGELGLKVSSLAVAEHYRGLTNGLVIDEADRSLANTNRTEPQLFVTNTVMVTPEDRIGLAEQCLRYLDGLR